MEAAPSVVPASVVVPVFNDAEPLRSLLADLRGDSALEIVVVDGGSSDGSAAVAERSADAVVAAVRSRGGQLCAGAARASHDWLWFLHADSRVSAAALAAFQAVRGGCGWGWFDVRLSGAAWPLRVVEASMNRRAAATGIATGDQGVFVHRRLLDAVGGVPRQPLMEDVELCKRLRRIAKPRRLRESIETSSRRWERDGVARTVWGMWALRLRYSLGEDAAALAERYYPDSRADSRTDDGPSAGA